VLAAVAIAVVLLIDRRPVLDRGALASEFAARRVDVALARLTVAPPDSLPESLRDVNWWPAPHRTARLERLASIEPAELLESPTLATLVAPLGALRSGPTQARLRDPADADMRFELRNVDLDLVVADLPVPAGTLVVPLEVDWIPGTRYRMVLADGRDGAMLALAGFRVLDTGSSQAAARAMADAHALGAPDHEGSSLLAALAALDAGLTLDAIERLTPLQSAPGYEAVARELHLLALESLGLDWSARRLMASGDGDGAEGRR
jgi:hypothetical protein